MQEVVLDKWQQDILDAKGNILLCTGRQVGKTLIFSRKACKYMLEHPNSQIIIVSITEDQAKLIIMMMLDYLEKHHKFFIARGRNKPTQSRICLKNGAVTIARPVGQTGDAVRGFTGNVLIIDEASRMPELAFEAAKPTLLTTAGEIWMCSTPHGKQGYFWECYQNKSGRFQIFHVNSEEVVNNRPISAGWTKEKKEAAIRFLEEEKADMSSLQYGQEYLGLFLEELRQYFPDELIAKSCIAKRCGIPKGDNFLGVDIARMGDDETTYEILHRSGDRLIHAENIVKKKQLTTQTEEEILGLNKGWNLNAIGIDAGAGSLGVGIFDRLMQNHETKRKTIPMNNRTISTDREGKKQQRIFKEDMYENLLALMEKGKIELLRDESVVMSLKSIQWELLTEGKLTKVRIFGSDSHIAEGLIRAAWLAQKQKVNKLWIACF